MPLFAISSKFAGQLETYLENASEISEQTVDAAESWIFSFLGTDLGADKSGDYRFYNSPNVEVMRAIAVRAGLSAEAVIEVDRLTIRDIPGTGTQREINNV